MLKINAFQALGRRERVADFFGGSVTSDGGGLLLREVEQRATILYRFEECFTDHHHEKLTEHAVLSLDSQNVIGLAPGCEDLNDHDHRVKDQMR